MPTQEDILFLRSAVEAGLLDSSRADEVLAALEKVEKLGASSSAREIALNRGYLTPAQLDKAATEVSAKTPTRESGVIGNYRILEKLGVGGMGVVYKARQLTMKRDVALKILPRRSARDHSFVKRFLREARSAARLNHPNIVQAFDVGEAEGVYYFAMELVDGESLRARLRRRGRIPEAEALQTARQIALALEHAHSHRMVHRDIKPDNILLTRNGVAKLADLGLAKRASDVAVTQGTQPLGTPLYMSPEQARGHADLDARSDIYSLGATLYEAVTGSPPFTGENAAALITKHLFEKPSSPRRAVPELSEGLAAVLLKTLAKKPQDRYESPTELLRDINRLLRGRAPVCAMVRGTPPGLRRSRRRRRRSPLVPVLASTSLFILALSIWLLYTSLAAPAEGPAAAPEPPRPQPRTYGAVRKPRPATPTSARAPSRDAGLEELERVREWAEAEARDPEAVVRRLRFILVNYPHSPAVEAARREIAQLEGRLQAKAREALDAAFLQARALAKAAKFAEAIALLDRFAAEHPDSAAEASEERGQILSDATGAERERRRQAQALAAQGDFAGALALHQQIVGFGIPQFAARARREIALLEQRQAEARQAARGKADDAYLRLRLAWIPLLAERQYAAARERLEAALAEPAMAPVRAELEADGRDLDALAAFWAAAERGAKSLPRDTEFSVGGIRGAFERFDAGVLHIHASGLACKKRLVDLLTNEALALAERGPAADDPAAALARGLFLLAEGKPKEAATAFAEGQAAGADATHCLALVERYRADLLEAEVEALVARAEELAGAGKWGGVAKAVAACERRCAATRSFAHRRARLEELATEARLADLTAVDLFHGRGRLVENGRRVELSYDFADPEQLADWDLRGDHWELRDGQLRLRGAQAVLRAPLEGDLQATFELADATGPPGNWGIALAEAAGAPPAYAIDLPERAGLPALLRAGQKAVARGQAAFRVGQARKVTFSLRAQRVGLEADGKEIFSCRADNGDAPAGLVLGLGAQAERGMRIGGLRLVATVAEGWVAGEIERLRARRRKHQQLAAKPWQSLFNGVTLNPWATEHGAWQVADEAATTASAGSLALRHEEHDDLELRLKVRPLQAGSVVRVCFRATREGERYGLFLGGGRGECCLLLYRGQNGRGDEALARFGERVDWKADRWYDLRIVAVGSELRAELDGSLLAVVRDDRRHRGGLSLDVLRGGAAFRDMALRALD